MELGVVPINLLPSPPGGAKDLLEPPLSALYLMPIWCIGQTRLTSIRLSLDVKKLWHLLESESHYYIF